MVTLFYFPTEKKNLRAHALWMTSLAVSKATPLRNEVPPVLTTGADARKSAAPAQPPPERPRPGPKGRNSAVFDDGCCN